MNQENKKALRLWLIDDNEIQTSMFASMLDFVTIPTELKTFSSSQQALTQLINCNQEDYPNLLLLDLFMPGMDGFEFLSQFHQHEALKSSSIKIYVLSSSILEEDSLKVKTFPAVQDFIVKPILINQIQVLLEREA